MITGQVETTVRKKNLVCTGPFRLEPENDGLSADNSDIRRSMHTMFSGPAIILSVGISEECGLRSNDVG